MSVHFVFPNDHTQSAWLNQTRALNVVRRAPAAAGSVRGCAEPRSRRAGAAGSPRSSPAGTGAVERRRSTGGHGEASGGSAALGLPRGAPCAAGSGAPGLLAARSVRRNPPSPTPGSFRHGTHSAGSSGRSSVIRRTLTLSTPGAAGGAGKVRSTSYVPYRGSFMGEGCRDQRGINDTLLPKCVTPGNHL